MDRLCVCRSGIHGVLCPDVQYLLQSRTFCECAAAHPGSGRCDFLPGQICRRTEAFMESEEYQKSNGLCVALSVVYLRNIPWD